MRPSASSRALQAILRDLLATEDGAIYFAGRVWGLDQRLDLGAVDPLVGCSAPNITLSGGTRLNERLRDGKGLLLDGRPGSPLEAVADRWSDRLAYEQIAAEEAPFTAALVRPDGVVAWADRGAVQSGEVERQITR